MMNLVIPSAQDSHYIGMVINCPMESLKSPLDNSRLVSSMIYHHELVALHRLFS